jgi:hypothetical protein
MTAMKPTRPARPTIPCYAADGPDGAFLGHRIPGDTHHAFRYILFDRS